MPVTRRAALAGSAALATVAAADAGSAYQFEFPSIDEGMLRLADFKGKVLLVVNTASFCGFTPQFKQLEAAQRALSPRGFSLVGVPSQDFGQEKDTNGEVKTFCEATFDVDFPMAGISHVRGSGAAPFYQWVRAQRRWEPEWNFFKVLLARDGSIAGTFSSGELPDSGALKAAIDVQLARTA